MSAWGPALRIALLQNHSGAGDVGRQLEALREGAREAHVRGARLLVCPELFMTGYNIGDRVAELAEPRDGPFLREAGALARELGIGIVCGYPERDQRLYNAAAILHPDAREAGGYRKLHLAPGNFERRLFTRGDALAWFALDGITIAVLICYDVEFPEAVRACALGGARLLVVPTALREAYAALTETMIPTRAFENGMFVAYANYAGSEADWRYCGASCVAAPDGRLLARAGREAQLVVADIDVAQVEAARARIPYLRDRRPELLA